MPIICRITFRGDMKSGREQYEWQQQRNEKSRSTTRIEHRAGSVGRVGLVH